MWSRRPTRYAVPSTPRLTFNTDLKMAVEREIRTPHLNFLQLFIIALKVRRHEHDSTGASIWFQNWRDGSWRVCGAWPCKAVWGKPQKPLEAEGAEDIMYNYLSVVSEMHILQYFVVVLCSSMSTVQAAGPVVGFWFTINPVQIICSCDTSPCFPLWISHCAGLKALDWGRWWQITEGCSESVMFCV